MKMLPEHRSIKPHAGYSRLSALSLGWALISINTTLPFLHLPEMPALGRVLLIAASCCQ
jgi:hypothetical protein